LIASRSQFAHAAYKTSYFEILELAFCKASSEIKFVLDRIALSGEPPKQALGKDAQSAPPNLQILFGGTVFAGAWTSGLVALGEAYGASKSSGRLSVLLDGLV
jgi:hypothetical protein